MYITAYVVSKKHSSSIFLKKSWSILVFGVSQTNDSMDVVIKIARIQRVNFSKRMIIRLPVINFVMFQDFTQDSRLWVLVDANRSQLKYFFNNDAGCVYMCIHTHTPIYLYISTIIVQTICIYSDLEGVEQWGDASWEKAIVSLSGLTTCRLYSWIYSTSAYFMLFTRFRRIISRRQKTHILRLSLDSEIYLKICKKISFLSIFQYYDWFLSISCFNILLF